MARLNTPKSGLKAKYLINRVRTAHELTWGVINDRWHGSRNVEMAVYADKVGKRSVPRPVISSPDDKPRGDADMGGFAIFRGKRPVAFVELTKGLYKQPVIHVLPEDELLGYVLAKTFQEHGDFYFRPTIKAAENIFPAKQYFDSEFRKQKKIEKQIEAMSAEEKRIRMK